MMIRIQTASRLHFGLLSLEADEVSFWPNHQGEAVLPARRFGGVGLMIARPGLVLRAEDAPSWSAEGPLAERVLTFAQRFWQSARTEYGPGTFAPRRLTLERAAPEHAGLGTGTQLGLAVGLALAASWGLSLDAGTLARHVGRGIRSALGVYGFARGGFLVEAGKRVPTELSPLVARLPFPETWRIVLTLPPDTPGLHGSREREAFARLARRGMTLARTETLCRLVLLGLLPALAAEDVQTFGEALFDFNSRVGEAFAAAQGGVYAGSYGTELVAYWRRQGVRGVGQSSWGPAIFALVGDAEQAEHLAENVRRQFTLNTEQVFVTRACNQGVAGNADLPG